MDKEFLKFENIEIKKLKFYPYKIPISIKDVDIDKSTVSDKFSKLRDCNFVSIGGSG